MHRAHVPSGGPESICRAGAALCLSKVEVAKHSLPLYVWVHAVTGFLLSTEEEVFIETKASLPEFPPQLGNRDKNTRHRAMVCGKKKKKQRSDRCDLGLGSKERF